MLLKPWLKPKTVPVAEPQAPSFPTINYEEAQRAPAEILNPASNEAALYTLQQFMAEGLVPYPFTDASEAARQFLRRLLEVKEPRKQVLLDIKYPQLYAFGVNHETNAPNFLEILCKLKRPILHLVRRDVVDQAISLLVANQTGAFLRSRSAAGADSGRARALHWLNPEDVYRIAKARRWASQQAAQTLDHIGAKVLLVHYEDLASESWAQVFRRIFAFLDHYADLPKSLPDTTERQNSRDLVSNLAEIRGFVAEKDPSLLSGA